MMEDALTLNSFQTLWMYSATYVFWPLGVTFSFWAVVKLLQVPNSSFVKSFYVFLITFVEWLILYLIAKIVFSGGHIPTIAFIFFPLLAPVGFKKIFKTNNKIMISAIILSALVNYLLISIFAFLTAYFILEI